ncbi:hypothetical protein NP233_g1896 [Leucocoprinus birnbaumii]|uniref:Uncharacterized protein n=1 Tax=Leucocoprinus birnbaumii TaxID=56174 RepID=A0AAD5W2B3_9AGAR|nr:hypothetical protein NP233_g1896 [Leucocoprinus birnbaumii]
MKLFGILFFIGILYAASRTESFHSLPKVILSITDIGYATAIKVILILRLRAIYGYDWKVSILLYTLIAMEICGGLAAFIGGLSFTVTSPMLIPFPLPGCWFWRTPSIWQTLEEKSTFTLWVIRFSATTIEAILMLIKLVEALKEERKFSDEPRLWLGIRARRHLTPVLYIFHRDGMLLIILVLVINTLGLVGQILPSSVTGGVDWRMWLILTYQLCGSRVILNVRRVNGRLTGSIVLAEHLSTIRFESRGQIDG